MPHVIVKLYPGKSEEQKTELAASITQSICEILGNKESSVSVSFEEIESSAWKDQVYTPDILQKPETLYKKPGYQPT